MAAKNFTKQQLLDLLKEKEAEEACDDTRSTVEVIPEEKKCSFKPIKAGLPACTAPASVDYGNHSYCKRHSRTVQALKVRDECAAEASVPVHEPTPVTPPKDPTPPRVPTPEPEVPVPIKTRFERVEKAIAPQVTKRVIRPNKWHRFEDPVTHILFDPKTKKAYGVQDRNGGVSPLTPEHVQMCIKNKWLYHEPPSTEEEDDEDQDEDDDEDQDEDDDEEDQEDGDDDDEDDEEEGDDDDEDDGDEEDDGEDNDEDDE